MNRKVAGAGAAAFLLLPFCLAQTAPAPEPADDAPISYGRYRALRSKTLGEDRTLLIRVPEDYGKSDKRYAVLYKLDGDVGVFLQASSAVSYLVDMTSHAPDHIVVGIENTDRRRDMAAGKGADNFNQFIAAELIPFVEKNYRTSGFRILAGQSASSQFALYSFLKQPGLFDAYVLSSFGLSRDALSLFESELRASSRLRNAGKKYIFIAHGKVDSYDPDGSRTRNGTLFLESLQRAVPATVLLERRIYEAEGHVPFPTMYDALRWIYSHEKVVR